VTRTLGGVLIGWTILVFLLRNQNQQVLRKIIKGTLIAFILVTINGLYYFFLLHVLTVFFVPVMILATIMIIWASLVLLKTSD